MQGEMTATLISLVVRLVLVLGAAGALTGMVDLDSCDDTVEGEVGIVEWVCETGYHVYQFTICDRRQGSCHKCRRSLRGGIIQGHVGVIRLTGRDSCCPHSLAADDAGRARLPARGCSQREGWHPGHVEPARWRCRYREREDT